MTIRKPGKKAQEPVPAEEPEKPDDEEEYTDDEPEEEPKEEGSATVEYVIDRNIVVEKPLAWTMLFDLEVPEEPQAVLEKK